MPNKMGIQTSGAYNTVITLMVIYFETPFIFMNSIGFINLNCMWGGAR